jgi:hypothetical protein
MTQACKLLYIFLIIYEGNYALVFASKLYTYQENSRTEPCDEVWDFNENSTFGSYRAVKSFGPKLRFNRSKAQQNAAVLYIHKAAEFRKSDYTTEFPVSDSIG